MTRDPQLDAAGALEELRRATEAAGAVFFPIRHHSPACAAHVRGLIARLRPASVLVEGPDNFDPLLPFLLHEKTRPPVAVYATYVDSARRVFRTNPEAGGPEAGQPARFAAYYPLTDYSPELVALRAGSAAGARLRFIDLPFAEQVIAERETLQHGVKPQVRTLFEESHLRQSEYLRSLARRSGCRDPDDLWDHLFEIRHRRTSGDDFVRQVAAYCLMARLDHSEETLAADGTLARERTMAAAVCDELERNAAEGRRGAVVVVTGGFHTVALPRLVADGARPEKRLKLSSDESVSVLMRYSFDQLDSLNGYGAGMPSPHYYQRLWTELEARLDDPFCEAAARIVVDVGRLTRERELPYALSAADEIAALQQARGLAALRGHPGPTREDLLDGLRSCFVKGPMDGEGGAVMDLVREVLAGDEIGEVPPEAGVPPLVVDFRRQCERLRLKVSDSGRRQIALDLYRKAGHREISRFFHCLTFLGTPFANQVGGPDFTRGVGLELVQEIWDYAWSPNAESALIEASIYGSTVQEAAANRLREAIAELEKEGKSRSTAEAVRLLTAACRMGLHRHLAGLLNLIEDLIAEDPQFPSLVGGLAELHLLWQSREPLEAHQLEAVPRLAATAYRRATFLVPDLARVNEDEVDRTLAALATLRELTAAADSPYDEELFAGGLATLAESPSARPPLAGGAAGILFGGGRMGEGRLLLLVRGQLESATADPGAKSGFLRGLLTTCREAAWQVPDLLAALDRLLRSWGDGDFQAALPHLRLAFTSLTPREVDRVAGIAGGFYGRADLGELVHAAVGEEDVTFNLGVSRTAAEILENDGLEDWIVEKP